MQQQSAITRTITVAAGVFAPGHLGELTQVLDFDLVDAVMATTASFGAAPVWFEGQPYIDGGY